jgi:hypothetical protein
MAGVPGRAAIAACVVVLACGGGADTDEAAVPDTAPAAAPASVALADVAGTWQIKAMNEAGDSIAGYELVATADNLGWTMNLPGRDPVPVRVVAVEGDSVVTEAGPYESILRPGVQVTVNAVSRFQGTSSTGTFVAHYTTTGADSVVRGTAMGTKIR